MTCDTSIATTEFSTARTKLSLAGIKVFGVTGPMCGGKSVWMNAIEDAAGSRAKVIRMDDFAKHILYDVHLLETMQILGFDPWIIKGGKLTLDTKRISAEWFANKEMKATLDAYARDKIYHSLLAELEQSSKPFVFIENAQLYQSGYSELCEAIVFVTADDAVLLSRGEGRGFTKNEVGERLKLQDWENVQTLMSARPTRVLNTTTTAKGETEEDARLFWEDLMVS